MAAILKNKSGFTSIRLRFAISDYQLPIYSWMDYGQHSVHTLTEAWVHSFWSLNPAPTTPYI